MPSLIDDLATEAQRRKAAARFMAIGWEREREQRLAELLDQAARLLTAAVDGMDTASIADATNEVPK